MSTQELRFLIVRADGAVRVAKRWPDLRPDEVAVRLKITFPDGWGRTVPGAVEIPMPDIPTVTAELLPEPEPAT